ncbi:unnamed protein product [Boreogadus saida]
MQRPKNTRDIKNQHLLEVWVRYGSVRLSPVGRVSILMPWHENVSRLSPASRCRGTTASALQETEVPKRCLATIPFSSLLRFSLLHIDVDVEEPGTSENPTRSFEIHNIGSHSFWP